MSKATIRLVGPWAWIWLSWVFSFLAWMLWAPGYASHDTMLFGLRVLFTVFLPLEVIGTATLDFTKPEVAQTLSQVLQRVAQLGKDNRWDAWYKGWDALVTGFALVISFAVGLAFWPVHPVVGVLLGLTVFMWNLFHWVKRWRYG